MKYQLSWSEVPDGKKVEWSFWDFLAILLIVLAGVLSFYLAATN